MPSNSYNTPTDWTAETPISVAQLQKMSDNTHYLQLRSDRMRAAAGGTVEIDTGEIIIAPVDGEGSYLVDTEAAASSDELDTITGGSNGDVVVLFSASSRTVVLTAGGNIDLAADQQLSQTSGLLLRYNGSLWQLIGGSGGDSAAVPMTNKDGTNRVAGDVVIFDTDNDLAFKTTTNLRDLRVCGVLKADIANNASGVVLSEAGKIVTVNCDTAAVARGQFLISSTTAGKATGGSYFREAGVFAIAMTSKAGGSTGTVQAMIVDNFRQAIVGTAGWKFGGLTGSGNPAVTTTQKFTMPTETWATVSGAALPAARARSSGLSYGTVAGYCMNGASDSGLSSQTSRYKLDYATETTSTLSASTANVSHTRGGMNFASKGFYTGGYQGSSNQTAFQKNLFSTDAYSAAGGSITTTRLYQGCLSDGTYGYIGGGTSTITDKFTDSTETCASSAASALASQSDHYCYASFPASAGYRASNNGGGTVNSRKLNFSTSTDGANGSSPSGNIDSGAYSADGVAIGYMFGTGAGNKLSANTDTYSSVSNYPTNIYAACASFAAL